MTSVTAILLCFIAGAAVALQAPINARLRTAVQSAPLSATISFIVGGFALLLVTLAMDRGRLSGALRGPWWLWAGGLLGAFYVIVALASVPRVGAAVVVAAAVLGQLLVGLLVDSAGWFGMPKVPLSTVRIAGALLL